MKYLLSLFLSMERPVLQRVVDFWPVHRHIYTHGVILALRIVCVPAAIKIIHWAKSWFYWSHCQNSHWVQGETRIWPVQFISDGMKPKQYYAPFKERVALTYCLYTNVISHTFIVLLSLIWYHAVSLWDATQTLCQWSQNWTPVLYFTNGF